MSTYKALVGKKIKSVSSDPSDSIDGQMWYNTTTGTLRGLALLEAFSSGGSLITGRQSGAGAGTQTDAIAFGGYSPPNNQENETELWNGASWFETSNLNTARYSHAGGGSSTGALAISGYTTTMVAVVEEWSGSTNSTKTIDTD